MKNLGVTARSPKQSVEMVKMMRKVSKVRKLEG